MTWLNGRKNLNNSSFRDNFWGLEICRFVVVLPDLDSIIIGVGLGLHYGAFAWVFVRWQKIIVELKFVFKNCLSRFGCNHKLSTYMSFRHELIQCRFSNFLFVSWWDHILSPCVISFLHEVNQYVFSNFPFVSWWNHKFGTYVDLICYFKLPFSERA